jgi:hypothetical protein
MNTNTTAHTLFRVTKIRLERVYDYSTGLYGEYRPYRTQVDFRTRYSDIVSAQRYAEHANKAADTLLARDDNRSPSRYEVQVEIAVMPNWEKLSETDPRQHVDRMNIQYNAENWGHGKSDDVG